MRMPPLSLRCRPQRSAPSRIKKLQLCQVLAHACAACGDNTMWYGAAVGLQVLIRKMTRDVPSTFARNRDLDGAVGVADERYEKQPRTEGRGLHAICNVVSEVATTAGTRPTLIYS